MILDKVFLGACSVRIGVVAPNLHGKLVFSDLHFGESGNFCFWFLGGRKLRGRRLQLRGADKGLNFLAISCMALTLAAKEPSFKILSSASPKTGPRQCFFSPT